MWIGHTCAGPGEGLTLGSRETPSPNVPENANHTKEHWPVVPRGWGGGGRVTTKKQIELAVLYLDGSRAGAGHSTAIICQNSQICKLKVRINKNLK